MPHSPSLAAGLASTIGLTLLCILSAIDGPNGCHPGGVSSPGRLVSNVTAHADIGSLQGQVGWSGSAPGSPCERHRKIKDSILKFGPALSGERSPVGFGDRWVGQSATGFRLLFVAHFPRAEFARRRNPYRTAQANTPTKWEHMAISSSCSTSCFRPTCSRRNGRPTGPDGSRKDMPLMPEDAVDLYNNLPNGMIVKMIEESFNEPFKTGPLIDQQGTLRHFRHPDELADVRLHHRESSEYKSRPRPRMRT